MKVIDILNKIANGEEVRFKILSEDEIYRYDYYNQICCEPSDKICEWGIDYRWLNEEVEIIEDKKIPKKLDLILDEQFSNDELQAYIKETQEKLNEIIDYLEDKQC